MFLEIILGITFALGTAFGVILAWCFRPRLSGAARSECFANQFVLTSAALHSNGAFSPAYKHRVGRYGVPE